MAQEIIHRQQAQHNEGLAQVIASSHIIYRDWIITCSFYAAVHYIEEKLCSNFNKHTESSIPCNNNKPTMSPHRWREELVRKHWPSIYPEYRKLHSASDMARYCKTGRLAIDYYQEQDALNFLNVSLQKIKNSI